MLHESKTSDILYIDSLDQRISRACFAVQQKYKISDIKKYQKKKTNDKKKKKITSHIILRE